ncbi:carbohydrate ABC transporter substrate-binding protein (CUT1 family) [Kribbella sp. VKM Ac-2569]|uniref:extracellular solute-binding protein n=1 Tax=Kribbella sp. VKM Ac-2569 TaxID=2512220 RepID=UPI00102B643F|nr:extracellular solute-binding protein [Kribbella sp. VKM Ac-2569]RZT16725.1 carbohydrate ABC transporter substrate-binding protein (CUT1 family) [Kribbella sp. VKM Ac-2569]
MTTLRGMTWEHPRGYDCQVAAAKEYARRTGVDVQWEYRSLQAFADEPIAGLAARYDLLVIDHPHVPLAAAEGLLAPLDGAGHDEELAALANDAVGNSHASYAHDGHQYGLATDSAAQVAVHRPDLLPTPPTEWDGVLELAREGRVLWPAKPIDAYSSLCTLAANRGTPVAAEPGRFLAEDDAAVVLDLMHRLAERVPEWCLAANPIEVAEALAGDGQWAYVPLAYGYTNYSRNGFRPHRLKYVDIPAGPRGVAGSQLGGAGIAVSAYTRELEAARAYAVWLASPEVQSGVYYDAGGQPGYASSWDDDRLNEDSWDFFRGIRQTLEGAWVRPRTAGYMEFQDVVSPWVTATLRGELTDAELVRRANALAERLLGER